VLKARDPDGLYVAAERGELLSFPGVTSEFEEPQRADLVLDTAALDVDACASRIIGLLKEKHIIR
jgi:adenylylsulfate kinase-like enzyme